MERLVSGFGNLWIGQLTGESVERDRLSLLDAYSQELQSACQSSYLTLQKRPTLCLCAGVGLGLVIALLSWLIGFTPSGHLLNAPILLGLAIGSLPRGLLYFNWVGLTQALGFSIGMGAVSWILVRQLSRRKNLKLQIDESQKTAATALFSSIIPVLITKVDAFQVLIWYGIATMFSVIIAGITAKSLHILFEKTSPSHL